MSKTGIKTGKSARALRFYHEPSDMEPLLPDDPQKQLEAQAQEVIRRAERLSGLLHPVTRQTVAGLVRSMNGYYSNLIEGHRTKPADIEAALKQDFSSDPGRRELQLLHWAHCETEREMEAKLKAQPELSICAPNFIAWLHGRFYERLSDRSKVAKSSGGREFVFFPGQLRQENVSVGRHLAPAHARLPVFLQRFASFYQEHVHTGPAALVAACAAHHRLVWIHPFMDGNGRVTRLFTQAWLIRAGVAGGGLWTLSRGLARQNEHYQARLANADEKRANDFDGRGYLSARCLREFCEFMLACALDQLEFMRGLLELEALESRIIGYAQTQETSGALPRRCHRVLQQMLLRGEIARGEVADIIGASERTGRSLTSRLLDKGLATSPSPKGPLRLGFPSSAAAWFFPQLYPAG